MPSTCANCKQPLTAADWHEHQSVCPGSAPISDLRSPSCDLSFLPRGAVLPPHLATNADFCTALAAYLQKRKAHGLPWYKGDVLRVTDFATEHGIPATLAAMKYSGMQGYKGLIADPNFIRAHPRNLRHTATTKADHAAGF